MKIETEEDEQFNRIVVEKNDGDEIELLSKVLGLLSRLAPAV
jgi:hypothetical protein